ncbi:MAG: dienelactone hydrolase family protein [Betaproteobacteria bacterium]|nr:dienelactone hydrolase family protein [Betaproteobacteria bacterium]
MKIAARALSVEKDGIPGYIAHPERTEPGPALLIIHHRYGVSGHLKSVACDLAQFGYATLVPDLNGLLGLPPAANAQATTSDGQFVQSIDSVWRYLGERREVDRGRVGVLGYCMGARLGIHFVAATPGVRAFVGYYPSVRDEPPSELRPRHPTDAAREIRCPSLVFFGGRDQIAPVSVQERLWSRFRENGQPLEWHFFSQAEHGFALGDGEGFDPHLAKLTWPLTCDFLCRHLGGE